MKEKITILLIDDDQVNNFIVASTINRLNIPHELIVKLNGLEGINYLLDCTKNKDLVSPDIILLDINMPTMDGWEFLEEYNAKLSQLHSEIFVFMVSSSVYNEDIEKANSYSFISDFISKPLSFEKLGSIIQNIKKR